MSDSERDDIDPRWLDEPYDPAWDRDPPWSREDRRGLERARAPGLVSAKPLEQTKRREVG